MNNRRFGLRKCSMKTIVEQNEPFCLGNLGGGDVASDFSLTETIMWF